MSKYGEYASERNEIVFNVMRELRSSLWNGKKRILFVLRMAFESSLHRAATYFIYNLLRHQKAQKKSKTCMTTSGESDCVWMVDGGRIREMESEREGARHRRRMRERISVKNILIIWKIKQEKYRRRCRWVSGVDIVFEPVFFFSVVSRLNWIMV